MFQPTPGVIGTVQANAAPSATVLQVNAAYAAYLASRLAAGDWTYARTGTQSGGAVEVLKITGVSGNLITVVRAVDYSTPLSLAGGVSQLEFVMGASAVQDMLTAQSLAPAVTVTGTGGVEVTEPTPNNFVVGMPSTGLTSNDASITLTSSGQNQFNLSINASTIGCCGT